MTRPNTAAPKAEWRQWARGVDVDWSAVSPTIAEALEAHLETNTAVLGFRPMPGEVDLRPLYALPKRRWLVTRTPTRGPLSVHDAGGPLEMHRYGFAQPVAGSHVVEPTDIDVVLVPGAVFDVSGGRVGRGKGYYDELLTRCRPDIELIGVTVDALVVDVVPTETHDISMTHIVTESGLRPVR
ncbi:MAG: 5-formyltetrahydrofolate cyclo-ligase [Acidimicrobiia bacterium]|nr:5-formyltetrahydrofolate cyclo-ligase [Acidimicrobiia bacterium]